MKPGKKMLAVISLVILFFIGVAVFGLGSEIKGITQMRYGIDIRGGVEAVFEPYGTDTEITEQELETAKQVIETRLDSQNITDREVIVDSKNKYLIVRFPWKSGEEDFHPEAAISELGEMAELSFRDPDGNVLLKGKNIKSSQAKKDSSNSIGNSYLVELNFDAEGAKLFEEATGKLIGKSMGIYMDDTLISNPVVEAKISGGQAVINNMESMSAAQELSDKINAGALPFSLKTTNFSTISPSLGNNSLNIMIAAGILAFVLVCGFMITWYRLPGVVACVVLVFQMVLQLLAISVPQYTLTLPGIAGIILSLGMAVDANIIISERITDEFGKGASIGKAIRNGYKNAFSSVLDGNVTTAIVAVILMIFGSGAMLSFGYTLFIGMIINVFVGVLVSKHLLQSLMEIDFWKKEKYFRKYKEKRTKKFYEWNKVYIAITAVIFGIGLIGCLTKGVKLDTQFTGGVVLNYASDVVPDTQKLEEAVQNITQRPVTIQITENNATQKNSIVVTMAGNTGITPKMQEDITKTVEDVSASANVELSETYAVEPYIGAQALKDACIAMILSLVFIVFYIWFRFSTLSAGITATIALLHDVAVVFVAFVVFQIPLNDAFVAVVLTIIGYSINDTIVVYDRIREMKKENTKTDIIQLVDESITQTFTRSINTSITTGICVFMIMLAGIIFHIDSIKEFALPMFFGLISGCYSSICIAGTIWAAWQKKRNKRA